jgi:hypothetical protein
MPAMWLGIDFSGNAAMWARGCRTSNVWIASAEPRPGRRRPALVDLRRVQDLPGDGEPFERLAALLGRREHAAAGIDAPCGLPAAHAGAGGHAALLALAAALPRDGRPFPTGEAFVRGITGRAPPLVPPKPHRAAEAQWLRRGVNVRSTLWAGARGGAQMTAACLVLLHRAGAPVWPFAASGQGPGPAGLVVEAFPAGQLREWGLPHHRYGAPSERPAREVIALALGARLDLGPFAPALAASADALDAALCLFGAIAVTEGRLAAPPGDRSAVEGWIAVHR